MDLILRMQREVTTMAAGPRAERRCGHQAGAWRLAIWSMVTVAALPLEAVEPTPAEGNPLRNPAAGMAIDAAAVPPMAMPQDTPAMAASSPRTLPEFEGIAQRSHPRLRSAMAAVEAARGKAVQARLYPNPFLAGGSPQISGPDSQWNGFVTQDIVTAGKLRLAQQAALREVQKAEYELIRARFDVLTGVRDDFYRLLVAQRRLEIFKLLLDIATRSYMIGTELAKAGEESRADVLFWAIERDRAEVRYLNASVFVETGRRRLAATIGLPRADIGEIDGDLFMQLPDFDLKQLQEAVVRANSLPRAAEAEIARAQWATERAVVQPIPDVNLLGGYQRQVDLPPDDQALLQVMVEVPLFNRNQGAIRAARADIAAARADLRDIELTLAETTATTIATFRTAQRQTRWFEEYILPKARETVSVTQLLYSQGEITFLNLLEAQRILNQTELEYVQAQEDRWRSAVEIANLLQLEIFPPSPDTPAAFMPAEEDETGLPMPPPLEGEPVRPPRELPGLQGGVDQLFRPQPAVEPGIGRLPSP